MRSLFSRSTKKRNAFAMLLFWLLALGVGVANACLLHPEAAGPQSAQQQGVFALGPALARRADGREARSQQPVSIRFLCLTLLRLLARPHTVRPVLRGARASLAPAAGRRPAGSGQAIRSIVDRIHWKERTMTSQPSPIAAALRTGIALGVTVSLFYALCTLARVAAPGAFIEFMNGLFHGMDFSGMVKARPFSIGGFLTGLIMLSL